MKKHNFSAGPSVISQDVFLEASKSVIEFDNSGLSLIEMSHRDKRFVNIMNRARELVLDLLGLKNKGYHALFLQGGASLQFLMIAYNFLEKKAAYLDTGNWSSKAIKQAQFIGDVDVVASSKDQNYRHIPKDYEVPSDADYFHITTNNTIFGTQIKKLPKTNVPVIADMSSDILSLQRDNSKYDVIYAGVQKNIGPAGATLVIVKDDMLSKKASRQIPSMLDYMSHIKSESMFNTPPVFSIYTSMLTLEKLKNEGGVPFIEKLNETKASMLYDEIDRNSLFVPFAEKEDRSTMNVTFNLLDSSHKYIFDNLCEKANIYNLNGHRSVGGYRASIYNALPLESVEVLVDIMKRFEKNI